MIATAVEGKWSGLTLVTLKMVCLCNLLIYQMLINLRVSLNVQNVTAGTTCLYNVGIDAYSISPAVAKTKYFGLFDDYLNTQLYDTGLLPCKFMATIYTSFEDIRSANKNKTLDFFFGDAPLSSCFQVCNVLLVLLVLHHYLCNSFKIGSMYLWTRPTHQQCLAYVTFQFETKLCTDHFNIVVECDWCWQAQYWACFQAEFALVPLVSIVDFHGGVSWTDVGMVMVTQANRKDINSIQDVRGKIVSGPLYCVWEGLLRKVLLLYGLCKAGWSARAVAGPVVGVGGEIL